MDQVTPWRGLHTQAPYHCSSEEGSISCCRESPGHFEEINSHHTAGIPLCLVCSFPRRQETHSSWRPALDRELAQPCPSQSLTSVEKSTFCFWGACVSSPNSPFFIELCNSLKFNVWRRVPSFFLMSVCWSLGKKGWPCVSGQCWVILAELKLETGRGRAQKGSQPPAPAGRRMSHTLSVSDHRQE